MTTDRQIYICKVSKHTKNVILLSQLLCLIDAQLIQHDHNCVHIIVYCLMVKRGRVGAMDPSLQNAVLSAVSSAAVPLVTMTSRQSTLGARESVTSGTCSGH